MRRFSTYLTAVVAWIACSPVEAARIETQPLAIYQSSEYGFSFAYPPWIFAPIAGKAGQGVNDAAKQRYGQAFISKDQRAFLVTAAARNDQRADARMLLATALRTTYASTRITYQRLWDGEYVVSGYKGRDIFYERASVNCGGRVVTAWVMTYPASERATYDPIVTELVRSFRPGEGRGRCP